MSSRHFSALDPAALEVRFSSTSLTSFGGYPLWAQFLDGLGSEQKFAQHVDTLRSANAFTAPDLARLFIDTRVLGAERLHHVDSLDEPGVHAEQTIAHGRRTCGRCHSVENAEGPAYPTPLDALRAPTATTGTAASCSSNFNSESTNHGATETGQLHVVSDSGSQSRGVVRSE
ncbi:MAG: hypothetical protein U0V87_13955 [Acidobacteriota bacterium]